MSTLEYQLQFYMKNIKFYGSIYNDKNLKNNYTIARYIFIILNLLLKY